MKKLSFIITFMMVVLALNAQTSRVPVKTADLPKAITDHVAKNYTGFMIKEATMVTENKMVSYDVMIHKGSTMETLVFDKEGKYLRTLPQPTATTTTPAKKPEDKSASPHKMK
jgi:hypothetical protein